ncbi:Clp protease N-terminal domain-containing protein [Dactylosporangium sp. NPDC005572]|uniref:Clp protease N-terminal domain-containing protein n=1 Tax=Dactylosporangium sp. NPDC005572 TaxID=3156889 RepID=UPI0033A7E221
MAEFDRYLKTMLTRAETEARADGSATVEAQHLLLAVAADPDSPPGRVLAEAGLDHAAIRAALHREFEASLETVGISLPALDAGPASPDPDRTPRPGASIQLALERGVKAGAGGDLRPAHLVLGILQAEVGTVPRALALAGADRGALIARVRETLR